MKNLLKNVLRSFGKTKLALVCLTFLTFLAVGIFSLLNNVTANLNNSYTSLRDQGQLAQIVVSEKYDYGPMQFEAQTANGTTVVINETGNDTTPSVSQNESLTIKLAPNSYNALVRLAETNSALDYTPYFTGQPVDWTGYDAAQGDTVVGWLSAAIARASAAFYAQLQSDPAIQVASQLQYLGLHYRREQALTVADGNQSKKVVQADQTDQINKLVMYSGRQPDTPLTSTYALDVQLWQQLSAAGAAALVDPTTSIPGINVVALQNFYRALALNLPTTQSQLQSELQAAANNSGKVADSAKDDVYALFNPRSAAIQNDGWRLTITFANTQSVALTDPSAYAAVISPGNWRLLESSKKLYQNEDEWSRIRSLSSTEQQAAIAAIPSQYKINIGAIEYVLFGVGLTPDMMYPVFDTSSLVPNPDSELLFYANAAGYARAHGSFLTNPTETSIVARFNQSNVSSQQLQTALNTLNAWSVQYMSWPANIKAAYAANDTTNYLNLTAARTVFIPALVQTISTVSILLTFIILGLAMFVGTLIIKSYIDKNRANFAVLRANGIKSLRINLSILLFGIIPSIVGGIIGYEIGYFLQMATIQLFSNYWFIPTTSASFSIAAFVLCIFLPFIVFACASLFIGWLAMRRSVAQGIKNDGDFKVSRFALVMKFPFRKLSILTRFRASLAFNSFWKLIILSVMSVATMLVFSFTLSTGGTFDTARTNTRTSQNYSYAIDLATPTAQSGLIKYQRFNDLGATEANVSGADPSWLLANKMQTVNNWGSQATSGVKYAWDNIHLVSFNDATKQTSDITYLENLVQSKLTLNYDIAAPGNVTNPWTLSASLMPANQLSASEAAYQNLLQAIIQADTNNRTALDTDSRYINTPVNPDSQMITYTINTTNAVNTNPVEMISSVLKPDYISWLNQQLNRIKDGSLPALDYKLTYNLIGLDAQTIGNAKGNGYSSPDYAYTRVEGTIGDNTNLSIIGIKDWVADNGSRPDNYLGPLLFDEEGNYLNHLLFVSPATNPVIINQAVATKYKWKVGSTFSVNVTNTYDRITKQLHNQTSTKTVTFTVIGINESAKNDTIYTAYNVANNILGFDAQMIAQGLPFNGYFANTLNTFNQSTPLFSASGLFPGTSSFSPQNAVMQQVLKATISAGTQTDADAAAKANYTRLLAALGLDSTTTLSDTQIDTYLTTLNTVYGGLPYNSMISFMTNVSADDALFASVAQTSMTIQSVVIGILVPIVLLIVILVSNMLIEQLRRIGIRLKALGFSDLKILGCFLAIYIPVFIIGIAVSIPLSLTLIAAYNAIIFGSAGIVLSTTLAPASVTLSFLALSAAFSVSFVLNYISLRRLKIAQEIKNY